MDNRAAARRGAVWWRDFECVPPAAYDLLVKWYGGGPRVARPGGAFGAPSGHICTYLGLICSILGHSWAGDDPCRRL